VAAFWPIDRENRVFTGSGCCQRIAPTSRWLLEILA